MAVKTLGAHKRSLASIPVSPKPIAPTPTFASGPSFRQIVSRSPHLIVQTTDKTEELFFTPEAENALAGASGIGLVIRPTEDFGAELSTAIADGQRDFQLLAGDYQLESWPAVPYGERLRFYGVGPDTRILFSGTLGDSTDVRDCMINAAGVEVPARMNAIPTDVACGAATPYYPPGTYFISVDGVDAMVVGGKARIRGQNRWEDQEATSSPGGGLLWGDLIEVEAIDGNTLELAWPTASYHTVGNSGGTPKTVVAVDSYEGWVFQDLTLVGNNIATGVLVEYGYDFTFRRVGFEHFAHAGVTALCSRRLTFDDCYLGEGCTCLVWGDATHVANVEGTTTNDKGDRECALGLSWGVVTVINDCAQWTIRDNTWRHKPVGLLLFGFRDMLCESNRYDDFDAVEWKVRNVSGLMAGSTQSQYIMGTLGVAVHQGVVTLDVASFNRRYRDFGTTVGTAWTSSLQDCTLWMHDTMMAIWQGPSINATKHPYQNVGGQVRYQMGIRTQDTDARIEGAYVIGCEYGFRYNSGDGLRVDGLKIFGAASNAGDDFIGALIGIHLESANNQLQMNDVVAQSLTYGPVDTFEFSDYSFSWITNISLNDQIALGPCLFARNNAQMVVGMGSTVSLDSSARTHTRKVVPTSHPHAGGIYRAVCNVGGFGATHGSMMMVESLSNQYGLLYVDEAVEVEAGMDLRLVNQIADGTAPLLYCSPYGAGPKVGNALNYRAPGLTGAAALVKAAMPTPSVAGEVLPSPPVPYLPAGLTGLVLALDASVGFSSTGIWNDRSTANNDAIQLTSSFRPAKQTVDGADAIVFDGVDNDMEGDSVPFGLNFADCTFVLVINSASDACFFTIQNATLPSHCITVRTAPTFASLVLSSDTGQAGEATVGYSAGWHILFCSISGGLLRISADGGAEVTAAVPSGGFASASRFRLARWDGVGGYWQGSAREVLGYNAYKNATDRGNLRTFLQGKWPGLP